MLKIENFHKIIIANWKLNGSATFVDTYLRKIKFDINNDKNKRVIICPPFTLINKIKSKNLSFGNVIGRIVQTAVPDREDFLSLPMT